MEFQVSTNAISIAKEHISHIQKFYRSTQVKLISFQVQFPDLLMTTQSGACWAFLYACLILIIAHEYKIPQNICVGRVQVPS